MSQNDPNWDHFRTFLSVMECGSLSAASRELGLTQPTVGRHVAALEAALGVQLFLRTPHGLVATDAAESLKPHAALVASDAAALIRAASSYAPNVGETVKGTVRVSASEVVGVEILPPILAALGEAHPGIVIELSLSDAVEDLLRQEADIAIRMAKPVQDALIVRRIGAIPIALFAHSRYLQARGVPESADDLAGHRMIGFDRQTEFIRAMRKRLPILDSMHAALKVDSNLAQLALIRAGCGIGACQTRLAAREPELVKVLGEAFSLELETFLVMHENLASTPRCRVTFDALIKGMLSYVRG
ncbi:DNA-binding transcriptional regulator, LysR family [Aureimonas altamirensis DSM 21988]|uniref:DNA-binding transcriptional regulator, LysR family n=1 Tax=Aureimonas altamirensis DSM 21988 TaxID=1121026 RepID=A0ABY1I3Y7_9HYPH|nr:LysR family transcriptional regulator [Aureimonas altamirensis]SHI57182.1 DNA-binding transcriptional regulator, LysR family [Aureimonas altamirensis DSM 21988]